jgi:hypothetical protein
MNEEIATRQQAIWRSVETFLVNPKLKPIAYCLLPIASLAFTLLCLHRTNQEKSNGDLNPGEIWGVADKLGSLDVGKTANVVIANGDPLDVKTDVKQVFIEGRRIPMENRQTRLRDQYGGVPPVPGK